MKKIILALIIFGAIVGSIEANTIAKLQFEGAEAAFAEKDYAEALVKLREAEQELG